MEEYALYLESGPKHKKTMVHVLDLLGCVIRGATTEEALAATPAGIGTFLHFLRRSGETVNADAPFTTRIETHVIGTAWVGEGNPACGFAPDFLPLTRQNLNRYISRLNSIHQDLIEIIQSLPLAALYTEPPDGHRSIYHILEHSAGSEYDYLRQQIGPDKDVLLAKQAINSGTPLLAGALLNYWQLLAEKLAAFTDDDLVRRVPHGHTTWTAYRTLRRCLEHSWEHREEIRVRLGIPINGISE